MNSDRDSRRIYVFGYATTKIDFDRIEFDIIGFG
jgi:hypothetical protein